MSEKEQWRQMNKEERLRHQLELQSRQIERVFSSHQVSARVAGGHVETKSIRFDLQSHLESGLHRLRELKHDLLSTLGVADVTFGRNEHGQWRLDIVRPHEPPVALLDLMPLLPELPENTAVLGLDEEGAPLLLPFSDPEISHTLVVGSGGAGKTALLRTIAISMAMTNRQSKLQLLIIDPDRHGEENRQLAPLVFLPHLLSQVIYEPEDAEETVQALVDEMYHRIKHDTVQPTIVTLIDNVELFFEMDSKPFITALTELLQRGAEAGIHLVIATSDPSEKWFSRLIQANLPLQLVGQMNDVADSLGSTAVAGSDANLLLGSGDFLALTEGSQIHFQAAFIGNYDLHLTLETIHRNRPRPLLAHPLELEPGDGSDRELIWQREDFTNSVDESTDVSNIDELPDEQEEV